MIDAKAFGVELAGIVKAATTPLVARIAALEAALAAFPAPADGRDGKDGADGAPGRDGTSVTIDDVMPEMLAHLDTFLASIPMPADGKDGVPGRDGADGKDGVDGEAGADGKDGADGRGGRDGQDGAPGRDGIDGRDGLAVMDLLRAAGGRLVAVMSDGRPKDLGVFVGKDGADGRDGRDGQDGAPGRDGFGFDDLSFEQTGERSAILRFVRGEDVKEFPLSLPGFVDCGVWKDGNTYQRGDGVTYAGSFWIAGDGAEGRPDAAKGWRLAVKKGRDGKDGEAGKKGEPGQPGKPGRDLTQLGADGSKW